MSSLVSYLNRINEQWEEKDGYLLSVSFTLTNGQVVKPMYSVDNPDGLVRQYVDEPFNEIVAAHVRCIGALQKRDFPLAYSEGNNVVQGFIKVLQILKEENWLLPVLNIVCRNLRILAFLCDKHADSSGNGLKPREASEKTAEVLMSCFRICSSDNRSSELETKKWGMMALSNQLFKVYFRINKLHLMKPLIRAIESSPLKDKFPLSEQITYRYYVGRKAMYDSDYDKANDFLSYAFLKCHRICKNNKRMILIYLVPVKILLGFMPSRAVLEKYDLLQLWDVCQAVRWGSPKKLTEVMDLHQEFFVTSGIYLILERLKMIAYRNLFKKVYLIVGSPVVPLDLIHAAVQTMDDPQIELDESTCILANLIHQGKIKGYISDSHQKVVLSKLDAFPRLAT